MPQQSREHAETLLAALDQLGEIVLVTDRSGCITYANRGFERISGYTKQEALGQRPSMLSSGQTSVNLYRELWATVLEGRIWQGQLVNRRKDGSLFDCRLVVTPVFHDGEIVRLVSVQEDITEQVQIRRALERQTEILEQQVAERTRDLEQHARALVHAEKLSTIGELSASIAHEVLNPLMGISGASQILQNRMAESDPNRALVQRIRSEINRLDETVRGLLSMVRPREQEPREIADIIVIIKSALDLVRIKARETKIDIRTECDGGPLYVDVNATQIRQIFLNLLLNAVHALESAGGLVRIQCSLENGKVVVRIHDNGPGIDPKLLPQLFEPFITSRNQGTGLGLSISRRIALRHGGDLTATNHPQGGACFFLNIAGRKIRPSKAHGKNRNKLMKWSFKIARIAGIDVYVHATFAFILLWTAWLYYRLGHGPRELLLGLFFVLAVFAIVVLHELGHALTARAFGVRTLDITLLPIGGVARLERMPEEPKAEFLVAVAGPAVNAVLAVVFGVAAWLVHGKGGLADLSLTGPLLPRLAWVNVSLAVFNLLPAFPMDGGPVLRSVLSMRHGRVKATKIAAGVGQFMALVFGILGLLGNPFLIVIAFFIWIGASAEANQTIMKYELMGVPVAAGMITDFAVLQSDDTLQTAVDHVLAGYQQDFPVVDQFGRPLGLLRRTELMRGLAEVGATGRAEQWMSAAQHQVGPNDSLIEAIQQLRDDSSGTAMVMQNGHLIGLLTLENIGELLMIRQAMQR